MNLKHTLIFAAIITLIGIIMLWNIWIHFSGIYEKCHNLAIMETLWGTVLFTLTTYLTHEIKIKIG